MDWSNQTQKSVIIIANLLIMHVTQSAKSSQVTLANSESQTWVNTTHLFATQAAMMDLNIVVII